MKRQFYHPKSGTPPYFEHYKWKFSDLLPFVNPQGAPALKFHCPKLHLEDVGFHNTHLPSQMLC